jgi:hypothetical protein
VNSQVSNKQISIHDSFHVFPLNEVRLRHGQLTTRFGSVPTPDPTCHLHASFIFSPSTSASPHSQTGGALVLDMTSLINPQLQSKFFTAPAEIRYAILANVVPETVHLSLNKKGLGLSPCVQRDNDDDPNCWNRCRTIGPDSGTDSRVSDSIYASRLRSSWGEHWRCESLVAYKQDNKDLDQRSDPLILVCKQMYVNEKVSCSGCTDDFSQVDRLCASDSGHCQISCPQSCYAQRHCIALEFTSARVRPVLHFCVLAMRASEPQELKYWAQTSASSLRGN